MFQKLGIAFVALVFTGTVAAQQPAPAASASASAGVKRTILQKVEVPGTNYEAVLGMAEIASGMNAGRHTHPGPEAGTVTEGEMMLMIDGQPDKVLKAGDSWQIPAGVVHDVRAVDKAGKVIVTYMIPKGMPIASPAPAK